MPHEVHAARWGPGGSIYFIANTGVRTQLFHADGPDAAPRPLTAGDHSLVGWNVHAPTGRHVFGISKRESRGDVHLLDGNGGNPVKVTSVFDYLDETFDLPVQEAIRWKGADGSEVEGLLYYPLGYEEGRRVPLVVQTHGGPAASDRFAFGYWANHVQILAARGYAVFKPNYRGSTGYGDAFLRDMVGHYFHQAHLDVMAGVDHLIEIGIADGERMAKMGWSAGGHMTNKIITHTDRFRAASSGAGAVNWISMYGQSDVRTYRTPWFGGTPWQEDAPIDVYWGHSPLKDIHRVTTPTIVLVGENDARVPPPQSVELYRALRSNGVDTHLYIAPREGHGWRELRHALFKVNVEIDWFERHVRGIEYRWETAPGDGDSGRAVTTDGESPVIGGENPPEEAPHDEGPSFFLPLRRGRIRRRGRDGAGPGKAADDHRRAHRRPLGRQPAPFSGRDRTALHPFRHRLGEERPHRSHPPDRRRWQRRRPADEWRKRGIESPLVAGRSVG